MVDAATSPDSLSILFDTLSFAAKALVVFLTVVISAVVVLTLARKGKRSEPHIEIKPLNERYEQLADEMRGAVLEPKAFKKYRKQEAKKAKAEAKAKSKRDEEESKPNLFVIDFKGDLMATAVENLREEVTGILSVAGQKDEVVVRIESPGGVVHGYGLAASQLHRIKDKEIRLTACVDKIAASGGYMMACVADDIIAAPFAVLGSIGVAAPVPNVHRLLTDHGIEYDEMTAGEYKRTVSVFGEITDKGRAKFQEQLEDAHLLFKAFVKENRPTLDIDEVATGEHWHGIRALEKGLVNRLMTSDDYLISHLETANLFEVAFRRPKNIKQRLASSTGEVLERVLVNVWTRLATVLP